MECNNSKNKIDLSTIKMPHIDLHDYDVVMVNTSAGKDSIAMLWDVIQRAKRQHFPLTKIVCVHADLGRAEWQGTMELAREQAAIWGLRFEVVKGTVAEPNRDLVDLIEKRGMWPSSAARYCTSDAKRAPIRRFMTQIVNECDLGRPCRILNCMGLRAQESTARSKKEPLSYSNASTKTTRHVWDWLPIFNWSEGEVWRVIHSEDLPYHFAYDLGMPRLSCVFCIFANKDALMIAGKANPELLDLYVDLEEKMDHQFTQKTSMKSIKEALAAGEEINTPKDWNM